jgi:RNA polymerase sigma-70 factor (ECF subfamily)
MSPALSSTALPRRDLTALDDNELVGLARTGDETAIRCLVRRHNQMLFRVARSILGSDGDAEDAVQSAYIAAFRHLDGFRADARFSTWLTRIAINEALTRRRRQRPTVGLERVDIEGSSHIIPFPGLEAPDPEVEMSRKEVHTLLEHLIDELPPLFRTAFVLREVEGLSVEDVAEQLDIQAETVRTRVFRARRLLRARLEQKLSSSFAGLFPFAGTRCEAMAERVVDGLRSERG